MDDVTIHIEVTINPTESEAKIRKAVQNVFGEIPIQMVSVAEEKRYVIKAKGSETLINFYNLLRRERIRNAARAMLFKGLEGNTINFYLNKQVAFAGHISFAEKTGESPLGPISIKVESKKPKELIDWLAPKTP